MFLYDAVKVHDHLYLLREYLGENLAMSMPLVIGEKRAALIDTGLGAAGELKQYVKTFTSLPLTVLCTHGHCDHIGGAALFDEVYLSPDDDALIANALSVKSRMQCVESAADSKKKIDYIRAHMVPPAPLTYHKLREGDRFDLGGVVLETLALPGHTAGSVVFLDERDGCVFAGDSVTDMPWLFLAESLPISQYLSALERFESRSAGLARIYSGHNTAPFARAILADLKQACRDLLAGVKPVPFTTFAGDAYAYSCGKVQIIYDTGRCY